MAAARLPRTGSNSVLCNFGLDDIDDRFANFGTDLRPVFGARATPPRGRMPLTVAVPDGE